MGLLKDLWEQVRGNFKYDILRFGAFWVVTTVGAGMIATFLGVASRWAHRPATNLDLFLIFGTVLLVSLCLGWVSRSKRPLVVLTAHGNASSELILSVRNNGAVDIFCAEAQLIHRNIHDNFKKMPFSLLWKESDKKGLLIPKGRSADLRIATYHDKGALGLIDSWSAMRFDSPVWGLV
jgi:hypothetical protein